MTAYIHSSLLRPHYFTDYNNPWGVFEVQTRMSKTSRAARANQTCLKFAES